MRLPSSACVFLVILLLLGFENTLCAQRSGSQPKHKRYRFVDLGTLGGPVSYGSPNGEGNQILNESGVVAGSADTALPDPNAPDFCFNLSCYVTHAVLWKDGVPTDLGALSGLNGSMAGAINARNWSVGYAQNGVMGSDHRRACNHAGPLG
jgi:hypothetical protein